MLALLGAPAWLTWPVLRLLGYAALALTLVTTVLLVKHEWDLGQAARHQVVQIHAAVKAETKAVAKVDKAAAAAEPVAQAKIVTRYRTIRREIPTYVTLHTPCIPWAVVRLHDAAALGVDPASLVPPAGQADDACSDVPTAAFVDTVVANYGLAAQNAEQLDALEKDVTDRATAVASTPAPY